MRHFKLSVIVVFLLMCNTVFAHKVTETLSTTNGDKVIVTYDIVHKNGRIDICFSYISKIIGNHDRKYKNAEEIVALFFDKKGGYPEDVHFTGNVNTKPFSVPSGLEYKKNEDDGFFVLDYTPPPTLSFESKTTKKVEVSIPIYLARHPKGKIGKYDVFQDCGSLNIVVTPEIVTQTTKKKAGQTVESYEYIEEAGTDYEEMAKSLVNKINTSLEWIEDGSSFGPELISQISALKDLKSKISNRRLLREIEETLAACDAKREKLKSQAEQQASLKREEEAKAQEANEERQVYMNCMDIQTCEHYLDLYPNGKYKDEVESKLNAFNEKKKQEEKNSNKRTIWMVIGGGLLAALLFVGNQVMQSFRNIRTQRSIMEMQQDVTRKATGTAKRRARSLIHNKTHQAINATRNKGRNLMQQGVEKTKTLKTKKRTGNPNNSQTNNAIGTKRSNTANKRINSNKQISI